MFCKCEYDYPYKCCSPNFTMSRPKLGKYRRYCLKALLEWADDLGRWVDLGHGKVWTTTYITYFYAHYKYC